MNVGVVTFLFSVHCLMMLYICTKFRKNISTGSELLSGHDFHTKIYKGHSLHKNVAGVTVLVFQTLSDNALYLYKLSKNITNGFRVMDGYTGRQTDNLGSPESSPQAAFSRDADHMETMNNSISP